LSGKVSVDFKNGNALRALTRVLLKKDWNLDVFIPPDRLVPTLPLRLNYLLWLEDVLVSIGKDIVKSPVHGIDIGKHPINLKIFPILICFKFSSVILGFRHRCSLCVSITCCQEK